MMTLREAIEAARADHGDESLWSDGGTDWTLELYEVEERDNGGDLTQPAYYDGRTIRAYRADGTIDMGEAVLTLVQR